MNLKIYERTRYQNIYRHKKNKNYIITISKPFKTSICEIDGVKIYDIETAKKIRDSYTSTAKVAKKGTLPTIWEKYMYNCIYISKNKKRTLKKKRLLYGKYISKCCPNKLIIKITTDDITNFFNNEVFKDTTNSQKNVVLKELKTFFNWCKPKYININPAKEIKPFDTPKKTIKFWTVDEFKRFILAVERDMKSNNLRIKKKAYLVYTLSYIDMAIGDRLGETRTLSYNSFIKKLGAVKIENTIDIDYSIDSSTKTYSSSRLAVAPDEIFNIVNSYKLFLSSECGLTVKNDDIIFWNYKNEKPYSDTVLRRYFYYYIDRSKVPKITLYELRHSYVANVLTQGCELAHISENIGHCNYNTTMKYYGGLSAALKKKVATASSNIF